MAKAAKTKKILPAIQVSGIADKGHAVGRDAAGEVVFIEGAVPGDVCDVQVNTRKKGVNFGSIARLISASPHRVDPVCAHFGTCGGCKWQHLEYSEQLKEKQLQVENALRRIGKVAETQHEPISGAVHNLYYRNKLEFSFSSRRWIDQAELDRGDTIERWEGLGFHRPGSFDKVVDVEHCYLQADPSNQIRNFLRSYAFEHELDFYDAKKQVGYLRNMIIRSSSLGELMVILSFKYEDADKRTALLDALLAQFPGISTLLYVINAKVNDTILDQEILTYSGPGFIHEMLGHIRYKIGPKSFFQTNTEQGTVLYDLARDFAGLTGKENVYDLYTGLGSIALYIADRCAQVTGIEEVAAAIDDARENAALNGISNAVFYAGDVKDILTPEFAARHGKPDVVITDPPRAGMHPEVVQTLLDLAAPRIVYVSCNAATQARDIALLQEAYTLIKSHPVDMFPHTDHVENVALLLRKDLLTA